MAIDQEEEKMYQKALYLARTQLSEGNRAEALETLSTIPQSSDVYGDALRLMMRKPHREHYLSKRLGEEITFH